MLNTSHHRHSVSPTIDTSVHQKKKQESKYFLNMILLDELEKTKLIITLHQYSHILQSYGYSSYIHKCESKSLMLRSFAISVSSAVPSSLPQPPKFESFRLLLPL